MIISEFKAKAIATLKRVNASGQPIVVTIRGEPVAQIHPVRAVSEDTITLGTGKNLIIQRPEDKELVGSEFSAEWEMNA